MCCSAMVRRMPKPLFLRRKRKLVPFEIFNLKLSDSNQNLSFKVRGIGEKNKELLTGLKINDYLIHHCLMKAKVYAWRMQHHENIMPK